MTNTDADADAAATAAVAAMDEEALKLAVAGMLDSVQTAMTSIEHVWKAVAASAMGAVRATAVLEGAMRAQVVIRCLTRCGWTPERIQQAAIKDATTRVGTVSTAEGAFLGALTCLADID